MDDNEKREATGALEVLSDDARAYGKSTWINATVTPREVKNLILKAAVRHMKNPEGFIQSRAGDETVTFTDRGEQAGGAYFTDREITQLRGIARTVAFWSVPANGFPRHLYPTEIPGYVPVSPPGEPFPMFSDQEEPW